VSGLSGISVNTIEYEAPDIIASKMKNKYLMLNILNPYGGMWGVGSNTCLLPSPNHSIARLGNVV
jgi:hypothetical protein